MKQSDRSRPATPCSLPILSLQRVQGNWSSQVPRLLPVAASECLVKTCRGRQQLPPYRQRRLLRGEVFALGIEQFEVAGDAGPVACVDDRQAPALGADAGFLGLQLFGQLPARIEQVGDFAEGLLNTALANSGNRATSETRTRWNEIPVPPNTFSR